MLDTSVVYLLSTSSFGDAAFFQRAINPEARTLLIQPQAVHGSIPLSAEMHCEWSADGPRR